MSPARGYQSGSPRGVLTILPHRLSDCRQSGGVPFFLMDYFIFDARYHTDPESATVLDVVDSLEEAKRVKRDFPDSVIVSESDLSDQSGG